MYKNVCIAVVGENGNETRMNSCLRIPQCEKFLFHHIYSHKADIAEVYKRMV